jgi:hypothetical protein
MVNTIYLQMFAHPERVVPPPRDGRLYTPGIRLLPTIASCTTPRAGITTGPAARSSRTPSLLLIRGSTNDTNTRERNSDGPKV